PTLAYSSPLALSLLSFVTPRALHSFPTRRSSDLAKDRPSMFGFRQLRGLVHRLYRISINPLGNKLCRHTVLAPQIEIPYRFLQCLLKLLQFFHRPLQGNSKGHVLQVIAVGHLGAATNRFLSFTSFGN